MSITYTYSMFFLHAGRISEIFSVVTLYVDILSPVLMTDKLWFMLIDRQALIWF